MGAPAEIFISEESSGFPMAVELVAYIGSHYQSHMMIGVIIVEAKRHTGSDALFIWSGIRAVVERRHDTTHDNGNETNVEVCFHKQMR